MRNKILFILFAALIYTFYYGSILLADTPSVKLQLAAKGPASDELSIDINADENYLTTDTASFL